MEAVSKTGLLRRLRKSGWQLLAAPFLLFVILPLAALFLRLTPADIGESLREAQVVKAITLSLQTSLVTVLVTLLAGTPVAYLIYRRRTPLYRFLDILIDLPTVLPPAVAGVALLMAFGRQGLVGSWLAQLGLSLPFTPAAVVLAQTFVAAPLYIRSAALGFSGVDCELKKAAALDGASRVQTFRFIMLPIAWHALLSGIVMTWARALGEFGATIIFAGNFPGRTQTMPLAIYLGFELDLKVALTLSALLIGTSFLILAVVKNYLNNHLESQNPVD
ncbi:ABC transporter permease [Levilinea saccharolytica]|uniref:Molybdenum transport system permease n=1 Tax=Levilinea saccharolytica TaxID=229921 RepID=A0A0M8JSG9_9CHLR|nr:ABC transporter permease [Levilinea saccharolytica]KPL87417.1 molybdenum ABC transporter permease [Levilinea saccharolytica]GAP19755.1 molybdate ABC transporter, permease protein [Levilinea saccharolytica]